MGVLQFDSDVPTAENHIYPMSLVHLIAAFSEGRPAHPQNTKEDPDSLGIDANLYRAIWPIDKMAFSANAGQWFFAMGLPLKGFPRHLFIYATVPWPMFDDAGDSWQELPYRQTQWHSIKPLCVTRGLQFGDITRQVLWPIEDELYKIDASPLRMQELLQFIRRFYLNHYKAYGKVTPAVSHLAESAALAEGFSKALVSAVLPSSAQMHESPDYMEALALADLIHPITARGPADVSQRISGTGGFYAPGHPADTFLSISVE